MATEAQVAANRLNAARSTGPRTAQGQAIVAQNAIKHGVFAHQDVILGEDREVYESRRRRLLAELQPVGEMEALLAQRIVSLSWRLQRVERLQNETFDFLLGKEIEESLEPYGDLLSPRDQQEIEESPDYNLSLAAGRTAAQDYSEDRVLERLSLHERRIENSLYKAMSQLQSRQLARKGQSAEGASHGLTRGNTQAAGLGDRATPSQPDHRQAALDDATRPGSQQPVADCAKQSQSPPDDGGHSPPYETEWAKQSQSPAVECGHDTPYETGPAGGCRREEDTKRAKQSQSPPVEGQHSPACETGRRSMRNKPNFRTRGEPGGGYGRTDRRPCKTKPISGVCSRRQGGPASSAARRVAYSCDTPALRPQAVPRGANAVGTRCDPHRFRGKCLPASL